MLLFTCSCAEEFFNIVFTSYIDSAGECQRFADST